VQLKKILILRPVSRCNQGSRKKGCWWES